MGCSGANICFVSSWAPLGDEEVPMFTEDRVQHNERELRHDERMRRNFRSRASRPCTGVHLESMPVNGHSQ